MRFLPRYNYAQLLASDSLLLLSYLLLQSNIVSYATNGSTAYEIKFHKHIGNLGLTFPNTGDCLTGHGTILTLYHYHGTILTLYHYHTTEDIHLSDFPTHFPSTKLSTGSQSLHKHDVTTQHQRTAEHTLYHYTYYRLYPKDIPALSSLIHTAITSQDASHPFQYPIST